MTAARDRRPGVRARGAAVLAALLLGALLPAPAPVAAGPTLPPRAAEPLPVVPLPPDVVPVVRPERPRGAGLPGALPPSGGEAGPPTVPAVPLWQAERAYE